MLVAHQQHLVVQVVQVVQAVKAADVINVAELLVHLESKAENLARRIRVRKRCVKSSTIWRHHHLVAQ
jgi:deoxyadenosine/deoxycytidine kinase